MFASFSSFFIASAFTAVDSAENLVCVVDWVFGWGTDDGDGVAVDDVDVVASDDGDNDVEVHADDGDDDVEVDGEMMAGVGGDIDEATDDEVDGDLVGDDGVAGFIGDDGALFGGDSS